MAEPAMRAGNAARGQGPGGGRGAERGAGPGGMYGGIGRGATAAAAAAAGGPGPNVMVQIDGDDASSSVSSLSEVADSGVDTARRAWAPLAILQFASAVNRFFQYNVLIDLFTNAGTPALFFAMACALWLIGAEAAAPYVMRRDHDFRRGWRNNKARLATYFLANFVTAVFTASYIVILYYTALTPGALDGSALRASNLLAAAVMQSIMTTAIVTSFCVDSCNEESAMRGERTRLIGGVLAAHPPTEEV